MQGWRRCWGGGRCWCGEDLRKELREGKGGRRGGGIEGQVVAVEGWEKRARAKVSLA